MIKLIIIDDDTLVCHALKTIIESTNDITVLALGHCADDAVSLYGEHRPDIILMDIRMGEITGIEAGKQIIKNFPDAKILFLTTFADNEYIIDALNLGAKGYLLKQDFESIVPALNAVYTGQNVFGNEIISKIPVMMNSSSKSLSKYDLSDKEIEIISLLANGLSNKEIANCQFLSEGTIRNYISIILEKLDLRDRTQLAIFYYKNT